jgi:hypothetical protein
MDLSLSYLDWFSQRQEAIQAPDMINLAHAAKE